MSKMRPTSELLKEVLLCQHKDALPLLFNIIKGLEKWYNFHVKPIVDKNKLKSETK